MPFLFPSLHVICSFFLESFLILWISEASQLCPCCESFSSLFWTFVLFNLETHFLLECILYILVFFLWTISSSVFSLFTLFGTPCLGYWSLRISQFSFIYLFDLLSKTFALTECLCLSQIYILKSYLLIWYRWGFGEVIEVKLGQRVALMLELKPF